MYTDPKGVSLPVNLRLVDKAEGTAKNELFREMVTEVLDWGLRPTVVSADRWYSVLENLKFLSAKGLGFLIGLEQNSIVSEREHEYVPVEGLELPACGQVVQLRKFGFVTVFRTLDKNGEPKYYAQYFRALKGEDLERRKPFVQPDRRLPPGRPFARNNRPYRTNG